MLKTAEKSPGGGEVKTDGIIVKKDGAVGWLIFNNPERLNAVSYEMWAAMTPALNDFAADPAIRSVVLRGAGDKAFVSGADISQFEAKRGSADAVAEYNATSARAGAALQHLPKPTIAMIRGYCIGGGLGIALGCDIRIASDNSRFAVPAAKLGLGYAYGGLKRLVDIVGPSFAKEIFYTARQFTAQEALTMGLVNRVVPEAELETYVRDYTDRIAANAPLTIKAAKLAADTAVTNPGKADIEAVDRAVDVCFNSEDYKEGRRAFLEKRRPKFVGR
jgi:enoyl-CoA hydratase